MTRFQCNASQEVCEPLQESSVQTTTTFKTDFVLTWQTWIVGREWRIGNNDILHHLAQKHGNCAAYPPSRESTFAAFPSNSEVLLGPSLCRLTRTAPPLEAAERGNQI